MNLLTPKEQFLNQFRGQNIFYLDGLIKPRTAPYEIVVDGDHVQLRSISQLTDEEKIILSCLYYDDNLNTIDIDFPIGSKIREERVNDAIAHYLYDTDRNNNIYASNDYLKCIGVLRPFTHLDENNKPVTLQPDEIIALGWAVDSPDKPPIDAINSAC